MGIDIVPPDVVVEIAWPLASEVEAFDNESGIDPVVDDAICMLTSARSPLPTTVVLRPNTIQVREADPFEQESDLPAAEAAAPTVALIELTLAAVNPTVN